MAYFAVYCRGGFEGKLESIFQKMVPDQIKETIEGIICPTATIQTVKESGIKRSFKKVSFNYIYIKVKQAENTLISSELYHFLAQIPFVQKIFKYDVPQAEVDEFCQTVGSSLEESEIEIHVDPIASDDTESLLRKVNEAKTVDELKQAEQMLEKELSNPTCLIEKTKVLLAKLKSKSKDKVTMTRSGKTEKIRMPLSILVNAVNHTKVSDKDLSNPHKLLKVVHSYFKRLVHNDRLAS